MGDTVATGSVAGTLIAVGLLLVATAKAAREALGWHQDGDPVLDRNWHPGLHPAATVALILLVIVAGWLALAAWVTASGAVPWPWELGAWSRRPRSDVTLLASATGVTMLHWLVAVGFGVTAVMTATGVISAVPSLLSLIHI